MISKQDRYFALVSLSHDGIGVNAEIAQSVHTAAGSIVQSHGQRHADLYATSALVSIPETHIHVFMEAIDGLRKEHTIHVQPAKHTPSINSSEAGDAEVLVYSWDQKGIVLNVSRTLAPIHASIERYGANQMGAAHSGAPLFVGKFVVSLGPDKSLMTLTHALTELADRYGYDFDVTAIGKSSVERRALGSNEFIH